MPHLAASIVYGFIGLLTVGLWWMTKVLWDDRKVARETERTWHLGILAMFVFCSVFSTLTFLYGVVMYIRLL